jgi:glycosyltransferase involved in cell wall biosynthesis
LGEVDPGQLASLYANAIALVQPSWIEGFAFPPYEALAHGTPAVVSDLPVFAELLAGSVLRFAPGDEDALAETLLLIAGDEGLRRRLVENGRPIVERLTWRAAARALGQLLTEASGR